MSIEHEHDLLKTAEMRSGKKMRKTIKPKRILCTKGVCDNFQNNHFNL